LAATTLRMWHVSRRSDGPARSAPRIQRQRKEVGISRQRLAAPPNKIEPAAAI